MADFGTALGYSKGELLLVKVEAYNVEGYGTPSDELTSGLVFQTVPIAVSNLAGTATDKESISLSWDPITDSPSDGYSSITEYEVWWDNGAGGSSALEFLESSALLTTYSKSGLTTGDNYRFAALAKNDHGSGPLSTETTILVAAVPDKMTSVIILPSGTSVKLFWSAPNTNGDAITAYRIKLLNSQTGTYAEDTTL